MNDSLMQGAWPEAAPAPQESTDDASLFLLRHAGQHVHARGCRATLPKPSRRSVPVAPASSPSLRVTSRSR